MGSEEKSLRPYGWLIVLAIAIGPGLVAVAGLLSFNEGFVSSTQASVWPGRWFAPTLESDGDVGGFASLPSFSSFCGTLNLWRQDGHLASAPARSSAAGRWRCP